MAPRKKAAVNTGRKSKQRKPETVEQTLARLYFTPNAPGAFGGVKALWRSVKATGDHQRRIKYKDVQNFLQKQRTYVLFKPRLMRFQKNRSLPIPGPNHLFAIDIWDLRRFSDKIKPAKGRKKSTLKKIEIYVLVGIDGFSKRIAAVPMFDKSQESVVSALKAVLKAGFRFRVLYSDNDCAFVGSKTLAFLKQNGIAHRTSSTHLHCYMAERAVQLLSKKLC